MAPTKKFKKMLVAAAIALASAGAHAAEVIYFNDFDGGTMGGVGVGTNPDAIASNNSAWQIHDGSSAAAGTTTGLSGNMVGHGTSALYIGAEKSMYSFSVDTTGFTNLQLMFDWAGVLHGADDEDGWNVVAYTGTLDSDLTGSPSYTLLPIDAGDPANDLTYRTMNNNNTSRLDDVQFGQNIGTNLVGKYGPGGSGDSGTAVFDVSGFDGAGVVNFRIGFGTDNDSNSSSGINFDNFKLTGDCPPGTPGCGGGGNPTPAPATLGLALIGLVAAYRHRRKKQ